MRLTVTGGRGMLGRAVVDAALRLGHEATGLGRAQLDVTDVGAVRRAMRELRPDAVVNCAAWTDVDGAEEHEEAATVVNGRAAGHVAAAAAEIGAFCLHLSTDYVFDGDAGRRPEPWVESDEPAPLSAYGRSKLAGERAVAAVAGEHAIVRTAWLFGAGGRNFVDTMLALGAEREEVQVVADQQGCPTWSEHLAGALLEVAERREAGVHHLAGAGHCSWYELALEVFDRAGMDVRVVPTTSQAFRRPAPRPAWSVLGSERPDALALPPWQEGVAGHLAARQAGAVR